ncbi:MAG: RNA polymerase sigma factor [Phycisphaerae bacterium]
MGRKILRSYGADRNATERLRVYYTIEETRSSVDASAANNDRALEAQLVARAQLGQEDALRRLVDLHKDRLYAFIWRMIHNHHDAEEICQDAFLKAFASLQSFSTEYRFSTWLFTIGYRVCLNRMRRKRVFTGEVEFGSIEDKSDARDLASLESEEATRLKETVWSAVDRLSPPQRAAVLLFYRNTMGCREIARVLDLPVATVKSHLHRARGRLRELLTALPEQEVEQFRNRSGLAG